MNRGRKIPAGGVSVLAILDKESHQRLRNIANERGIHLQVLTAAVLDWAGEQCGRDLVRLGVHIPAFAADLQPPEPK